MKRIISCLLVCMSLAGTPDRVEQALKLFFNDLYASTTTLRTYSYPSTIGTGGFYRLADSVTNQSITITSSNVTLDLNGQTISGGASGIIINPGLSNIIIKNGTISNVTGDGIQINGGCSGIILDTVTIKQADHAISCNNGTNGIIRNCDLLLSNSGVQLSSCHNFVLENCTAQANKYAGFSLVSSTTCCLFDCKALSTGQSNTDLYGNVYGFVNNGGSANIFQRCIANSTQGLTFTGSQSIIAGFALLGTGTQCHAILDCQAANATSSSSGLTIPYGIYLQSTLTNLTTLTAMPPGTTASATVDSLSWSPDGKYLVAGTTATNGTTVDIGLFQYDRVANQLILLQLIPHPTGSQRVFSLTWSPGGTYLAASYSLGANAINILIFGFDSINQSLTETARVTTTATGVGDLSWLNESYLLAASDSTIPSIYKFNSVTGKLTLVASITTTRAESGQWSPVTSLSFFAMGFVNGTNADLKVYFFNQATNTITQISNTLTISSSAGGINQLRWSSDGRYIATASDGTSGFNIVRFENNTLILVASVASSGLLAQSVSWSPDNKYIAFGSVTADAMRVYAFDYATEALTLAATAATFGGAIRDVAWSPDGGVIAANGTTTTNQQIDIYSALQFPAGNTIMNNTVYCDSGNRLVSGVGISGSSITNFIVGNTAYNNPFNYQFVCNAFNQLYGDGPTALQNIEVDKNVPILTPIDIPQTVDRIRFLLQSLVDDLL